MTLSEEQTIQQVIRDMRNAAGRFHLHLHGVQLQLWADQLSALLSDRQTRGQETTK
jgi:hypothetical protein